MKKLLCLLIGMSSLFLFSLHIEAQVPDKDKLYSRKIEDAYWYAKNGKIELKKGFWHFAATQKRLNTETEKIVDEDYSCFCIFTIMNNSSATYKVNPSITLLDYYRATLYRLPPAKYFGDTKEHEDFRNSYDQIRLFKPRILSPGEGYVYKGEFSVTRETVLKTNRLKLELSITEIMDKP